MVYLYMYIYLHKYIHVYIYGTGDADSYHQQFERSCECKFPAAAGLAADAGKQRLSAPFQAVSMSIIQATVNIYGKITGHGSYIRALVGAIVYSLCRNPCPSKHGKPEAVIHS